MFEMIIKIVLELEMTKQDVSRFAGETAIIKGCLCGWSWKRGIDNGTEEEGHKKGPKKRCTGRDYAYLLFS